MNMAPAESLAGASFLHTGLMFPPGKLLALGGKPINDPLITA
jgi:hypothetical protein